MDGERVEETTWRGFQKTGIRLDINEKLKKSWTLTILGNYDCGKFREWKEKSQKLTQKLRQWLQL